VERLDLKSAVVFVGQLPQSEALQYVREADVCTSPFFPTPILQSASPTKLVEYMAMGKAVVANDHPEQKRVIEESGAGYCVPYDEEPFAAAIVNLLQNPEIARRMGERGRSYVIEHRAYGVIADRVERRILEVVGGSCSPA
jgi:glycosyltransferase involved in cell wall biosynthesis